MATTNAAKAGLGAVAFAGLIWAVLSLRTAPQMGPDDEVFATVDALFTAVTSRDDKRLTACEARLRGYRDAKKLPKKSADFLDGIIAKARGGGWKTAAERLYDYMLAQKREGAKF